MNALDALALDQANRAAVEAARAVIEARGPFAPLVIVGARGSGRRELLLVIADAVRAREARPSLELLDPKTLAARSREADLSGRSEEFAARLAEADLVLLDDLEDLARYADTQGWLADLLDRRRAARRETVLASSIAVEAMAGLDPRVRKRLASGTTVPFMLPAPPARLAFLRGRHSGQATTLPEPVLRAVAEAELPSFRDYAGAVARLLAFQEASPVPLSAEDALVLIGASRPLSEAGQRVRNGDRHPGSQLPPVRSEPDEFSVFVSEVADELAGQLDGWRERVGHVIERWRKAGFATRRLEALLAEEFPGDPEPMLEEYESAATELAGLAKEATALSPDLGGAEAFRDPDQLPAARVLLEAARLRAPLSTPLPQYRWEEFVEGPTTRLSVRAGRDVIEEPGRRYSPLIVTGGSGTGKSHFLHGIGNALIARGVGPVACLAGPAFAAEVRVLADATVAAEWRRRYQWVAAFLLDDLHLLTGEPRAQQELAALVGELMEGRRQLVFASLRPVEQLSELEPDLVRLLQQGLSVELPPPDREVRVAVIRRLLATTPAAGNPALLDYLASRPAESVRAVQGMVHRVLSAAEAQQVAPTPQLAREVLEFAASPRRFSEGAGGRASGIPAPGASLVKSGEKMVKRWPRITDRLCSELR